MTNFEGIDPELPRRHIQRQTRRHFLGEGSLGLGAAFLGGGLAGAMADGSGAINQAVASEAGSIAGPQDSFRLPAKAKRVIYLHMAGAPSQLELFDYKPDLARLDGQDCPQSFLEGKRFAFIQGVPQMLGPQAKFSQHGDSGAWISDRLPHLQTVADKLCWIKSMTTTQFNHGPAQLLLHTGDANLGSASMGAWTMYGLGRINDNLPGFIVLVSGGKTPSAGKSVWGSGYLPGVHQGVQCRSSGDPVLYLSNPEGVSRKQRRAALDAIAAINQQTFEDVGDPEILTRIDQYEMAFRMQTTAAEAFDLNAESAATIADYGAEPGVESFANNCLLARRLAERDVRFIQLFHWGWDSHGSSANEAINMGFADRCKETDRPIAALLNDLDRRGLLDETLVVWGGEFGRTPMRENRNGREMKFIGRDHNPGGFTIWMAGGGVAAGTTYGQTDEIGYEAVVDPVTPHDLHATILRLLGVDHLRLTYFNQGVHKRLSNITKHARVIDPVIGGLG